jgi:hypothetical protein
MLESCAGRRAEQSLGFLKVLAALARLWGARNHSCSSAVLASGRRSASFNAKLRNTLKVDLSIQINGSSSKGKGEETVLRMVATVSSPTLVKGIRLLNMK